MSCWKPSRSCAEGGSLVRAQCRVLSASSQHESLKQVLKKYEEGTGHREKEVKDGLQGQAALTVE